MSSTEESLHKTLSRELTAPKNEHTSPQKLSYSTNLDIVRLEKTVSMVATMIQGFTRLFNPPTNMAKPPHSLSTQIDLASSQQALEVLLGLNVSSALVSKAPEFVGGLSTETPNLKTAEFRTIQELMVRVGMQQRPEYFAPLEEGSPLPADAGLSIGVKFLQEFVQKGSLDAWIPHIQKAFEQTEASQKTAGLEFMEGIIKILKLVGSANVGDPTQDPLNKYVDPAKIKRVIELSQWLENNHGHPEYDSFQQEFMQVDKHVKKCRERALKEGGEYIFSLLKLMQPDFQDMESLEEVTAYKEAEWNARKRTEFQNYVLTEFKEIDIFEPVKLRAFWEKLQREQYGDICLEMVCESFTDEYKNKPAHQIVQQIWAVSHLDTIHYRPQEARSRMPSASIDGRFAPNFGYKMPVSDAYQEWSQNPLVRASGDIILDAFHFMVDFGQRLNIDVFLDRLSKHLSDKRKETQDRIRNPHEYDSFMISFELYLLESIFREPFKCGENRTIPGELKKVSENRQSLFEKARAALLEFKSFSAKMLDLRPSKVQLTEADLFRGLVFGIGFNGKIFDSLSLEHTHKDVNQIWLTFSDSGRTLGGNLFLSFLIHVAKQPSDRLTPSLDRSVTYAKYNLARYKALIKKQINQIIKDNYFVPNQHWDAHMLTYIKREREKFEGFMSQLEQDIPFEALDAQLQKWILKASNWYCLPPQVEVQIPGEMPLKEQETQHLARTLLFDALTRRSFSREYPNLMPLLFWHWKEEVLKHSVINEAEMRTEIVKANTLNDLTEPLKSTVLKVLDQLVWEVHPELKATWETTINQQFELFMRPKVKAIEKALEAANQTIKKLEKAKTKNPNMLDKIQEPLNRAQRQLEGAQQQKQTLSQNPSELAYEEYKAFRKFFFEERDVSQCVEPVFARVLGHDRFFSVFISKKTMQTNIKDSRNRTHVPLQLGNRIPQDVIAPCDKRCQHHALGHLYVGDVLSYQSADRLDQMRQTHGLGEVPDRLMVMERLQSIVESYTAQQNTLVVSVPTQTESYNLENTRNDTQITLQTELDGDVVKKEDIKAVPKFCSR